MRAIAAFVRSKAADLGQTEPEKDVGSSSRAQA
jgi:hypothetical protein